MTDARSPRTPSAPPGFANGATLMQRRGWLLARESPGQHVALTPKFDQQLWAAGRLATGARLETGQLVLDLLSVALQRS